MQTLLFLYLNGQLFYQRIFIRSLRLMLLKPDMLYMNQNNCQLTYKHSSAVGLFDWFRCSINFKIYKHSWLIPQQVSSIIRFGSENLLLVMISLKVDPQKSLCAVSKLQSMQPKLKISLLKEHIPPDKTCGSQYPGDPLDIFKSY